MKSFIEFRRLFETPSNRNNMNNIILSKRKISISKKRNINKFNFPNKINSTRQFFFIKNQNITDNYKTINNILFSSSSKINKTKQQFIKNKKEINKSNQILNNINAKKYKFSINNTSDSTVNFTDNYNSCKNLYNNQINKKLDYLKERCFNLLNKYNKILDNIEMKNND